MAKTFNWNLHLLIQILCNCVITKLSQLVQSNCAGQIEWTLGFWIYVCVCSTFTAKNDLEIVESIVSHQNKFCRIISNSIESIAFSKDTAIALAGNVHSNDVFEVHHMFENAQATTNDDVQCECAKYLNHDDLQTPWNEGRSDNKSQLSPEDRKQPPGPPFTNMV